MKRLPAIIISLTIVVSLIFSVLPLHVLADGMMIRPDPYADRWDYVNETNQQAFINYENGLQKMIISVGVNGNNNNTIWLFPVPAEPEKVAIDVITELPQMRGEELSRTAQSKHEDIRNSLFITQIYPLPLGLLSSSTNMMTIPTLTGSDFTTSMARGTENTQDVVVSEHLEKEGLITEIITAKTANGLYDYLKNKGLKIESGTIPVLDNYVGKQYSFIASWVNNTAYYNPSLVYNSYQGYQKGVFVTFPTKNIYFPLLPTSIYGSVIVPATIRILGHVTPEIYQDIKSYTNVEYYHDSYPIRNNGLLKFLNRKTDSFDYTKIEINAPSKYLTDDLWISNQTPLKVYYTSFLALHPYISSLILLVFISIFTGIFTGYILFKDLRKNILKLGLIGFSNCFTLLMLILVTILTSTKNNNELMTIPLAELKRKGYYQKRRIAVICIVIAIPLLGFGFLILPAIWDTIVYHGLSYSPFENISFLLICYIIPVSLLISSKILGRIKTEDTFLFDQLKTNHYSRWTFIPCDRMKLVFVPFYSVTFLYISWLLVKLIEITV